MIRTSDLSIGYGHSIAAGISFELRAGEILLLLGPNGCGKTTLIRTLLRALPAISGRVEIGGKDLGELQVDEVARLLALVPQDETVPFEFTAREMVSMGRIARSRWWAESPVDHDIVESAMKSQNCLSYADRSITTLSGGESQRVRLARAIAQEAPVWLLDEPNSHLDVRYQLELETTIRNGCAEGKCILASIHDLAVAQRLAAPVLLFVEGRVEGPASLQELASSGAMARAFGVPFGVDQAGAVFVATEAGLPGPVSFE